MTPLIILLSVLAGLLLIAALLLCLRLKVFVSYAGRFAVKVKYGFISLSYDMAEFETAPAEEGEIKKPRKIKKQKPKVQRTLKENLLFIRDCLAYGYFRLGKRIRLERYVLKVTVASDDAAKTGITYGAVSGVVAAAQRVAEGMNRNINAEIESECKPDFLVEEPDVLVDIGVSAKMWNIVLTALRIRKLNRIYNKEAKTAKRSSKP